jgi:phage terminase small subunit
MTDTLSDKQALFCREYIVDFNGAQAAIRAGYSPKSAKVTASRLLTDANVAVKLSELAKARMEEADVTVARVIKEFLRIAMADVGEAFDEHGNLLPISASSLTSGRRARDRASQPSSRGVGGISSSATPRTLTTRTAPRSRSPPTTSRTASGKS